MARYRCTWSSRAMPCRATPGRAMPARTTPNWSMPSRATSSRAMWSRARPKRVRTTLAKTGSLTVSSGDSVTSNVDTNPTLPSRVRLMWARTPKGTEVGSVNIGPGTGYDRILVTPHHPKPLTHRPTTSARKSTWNKLSWKRIVSIETRERKAGTQEVSNGLQDAEFNLSFEGLFASTENFDLWMRWFKWIKLPPCNLWHGSNISCENIGTPTIWRMDCKVVIITGKALPV